MEPINSNNLSELRNSFTQNHSYLGFSQGDFTEIPVQASKVWLVPNKVIELPLWVLRSTVLFPNDTIPLKGEHGKQSFLYAIGLSQEPEEQLSEEDEELGDQFAFQRYLLLRFLGLPQAELEAEEVLLAQQIREELQSTGEPVVVCIFDYLPAQVCREEGLEFEMPLELPRQVQESHQRLLKLYRTMKELIVQIIERQTDDGYATLRQVKHTHKQIVLLRRSIRHDRASGNVEMDGEQVEGSETSPLLPRQESPLANSGIGTEQMQVEVAKEAVEASLVQYPGVFAVAHLCTSEIDGTTHCASVGVTVCIKKGKIDHVENTFSIICESIQRGIILSTYSKNETTFCQLLVLGEENPSALSPTGATVLTHLPRFARNPTLQGAALAWPKWVPQRYDACVLHEALKAKAMVLLSAKMPDEPVASSYYVAKNLILDNSERLALLALPLSSRILQLIEILKSYSSICCKNCGTVLASQDSVFSISSDGPQNAFVNTYGYVHDTITLTGLSVAPRLVGRAETKDCWFYGYAWIIAICPMCHRHLGWKYVRTLPDIEPQQFWGLSRPSITIEKI